jgi:ribosome recycling factor
MTGEAVLSEAREKMKKSLGALDRELTGIRAGKASAALLDSVKVDYYGTATPVNQVAAIKVPEPRLIVLQPFEKSMVQAVAKAIQAAGLGLNPTDDGTVVRIPIPQLTEERRKDLVKKAKAVGEHAKVSLRQVRREANDQLKKLQTDKDLSEDDAHRLEGEVQQMTDEHVKKIDDVLKAKENEILEI